MWLSRWKANRVIDRKIQMLAEQAKDDEQVRVVLELLKAQRERGLRLDPNTLFTGLVSLGSVILILHMEEIRPMASKAFAFVKRT